MQFNYSGNISEDMNITISLVKWRLLTDELGTETGEGKVQTARNIYRHFFFV